jgi:predicted negative regulator of RcsB-dependent stress response
MVEAVRKPADRMLFVTGDAKTAKLQLLWVVEHGQDEWRDLARLRLATLLLDEQAYDEAFKQVDGAVSGGYAARFQDTRGDILGAQGKKVEARAAYQAALAKLDEADQQSGRSESTLPDRQANAAYREILHLKLDALGESN